MYGQALSVRAADKDALAPCLAKLVPIVQRRPGRRTSTDPARTNDVIVRRCRPTPDSVWSYSPGLADFAVRPSMRDRGIVGNGPDATLGNLETAAGHPDDRDPDADLRARRASR